MEPKGEEEQGAAEGDCLVERCLSDHLTPFGSVSSATLWFFCTKLSPRWY